MTLIRKMGSKVRRSLSASPREVDRIRKSPVEVADLDDLSAYRLNTFPVLDVLTNAEVDHFVVSNPRGLSRPHVGIRAPDLAKAVNLLSLEANDLPSLAEISDQTSKRRVTPTNRLNALTAAQIEVGRILLFSPMVNPETKRNFDRSHGCVLEIWKETNGSLVSPDKRKNLVITEEAQRNSLPIDLLGAEARTYAPLDAVDMFDVQFPIDVVYLWVDGSDPEWRRKKEKAAGITPGPESQIPARFRQFDELRYSLRSISRYAPWINHVYLVTDAQRPTWLNEHGTNLTVIDHTEILPKSALPTFNSHALTASIHHIPGLSDHFILFNDDILLGRPTRPERFINSNGTTRFFLSRHSVSSTPNLAHEHARIRTCDLIEKSTGMRPTQLFRHTPNALNKELMGSLAEEFKEEWDMTVHNTFRSSDDIVPSYLHHYVGYTRQRTQPASISYEYLELGANNFEEQLSAYQQDEPREVLCLNDIGATMSDLNRDQLELFLEAQFPHPSPYEISP